jgi:hypothetical protein
MEVKYIDAEFKPEDVPVSYELAYVGMRVKRGPDWDFNSYGNQGAGWNGIIEEIYPTLNNHLNIAKVRWDNGDTNYYRLGKNWYNYSKDRESSFYDLAVAQR